MSFHKNQVSNHVIYSSELVYADSTAREAATGFVSADVGKVALQQDDTSFWILTAITPVWSELTNLVSGDFSAVSDDAVPVNSGSLVFIDSGATVSTITGEWTFADPINVPAGSVNVGTTMSLSEGGSDLVVADLIADSMAFSSNAAFDDTEGSTPTSFVNFGPGLVFPLNTDDSQTLTDNPLIFQNTTIVPAPFEFGLNDRVIFRTGSAMTNFRVKFTDNATGIVIRYIPSLAAFNGDAPGLDLAAGDNTLFLAETGIDTANEFFFGFVPIILTPGQVVDFEVVADSVDLLGNLAGFPYLVVEAHLGIRVFLQSVAHDNFSVQDSFVKFSSAYTTTTAQEGGMVVNYLPTATADTVTDLTFTAGIASTSNPTIATDTASVFSVNDIVMISGTEAQENDGIFEVLTHTANLLTVRGVGTTATDEAFSRDQLIDKTSDSAVITKVNVAVLQADQSGEFQTAKGSATGDISFKDIVTTEDTLTSGFITTGNGSSDIQAATPDDTAGVFVEDANSSLTIRPVINDTTFFRLTDSSGVVTSEFAYNDQSDRAFLTGPAQLTIESEGSAVNIDAATGLTLLTSSDTVSITASADDILLNVDLDNAVEIVRTNGSNLTSLFRIEQGGTNAATINFFAGTQTPLGNVTGAPGDVYYLKLDEFSTIFHHQGTGLDNTSWVAASGNVTTSDTLTNNFMVKGNGGEDIDIASTDDTAGVFVQAGNSTLTIRPVTDDTVAFRLDDDTGTSVAEFRYDDLGDIVDLEALTDLFILSTAQTTVKGTTGLELSTTTGTLDIEGGSTINLTVTVNDAVIINRSTGTNAVTMFRINQAGTNPAEINFFAGSQTPNTNVTGAPGDLYFFKSGAASTLFIHEGATADDTSWTEVVTTGTAGNVTTSDVLTNNFLVRGNGTTDIDIVSSDDVAGIFTEATNTSLTIRADTDDSITYQLMDSAGVSAAVFQYNDMTDQVILASTDEMTVEALSGSDLNLIGDQNLDMTATLGSVSLTATTTMGIQSTTDMTIESTTGGIDITSQDPVSIESTSSTVTISTSTDVEVALDAGGAMRFSRPNGNDDQEMISMSTAGGNNAAAFDLMIGDRDPSSLNAFNNTLWMVQDGNDSAPFFNVGASGQTSDYVNLRNGSTIIFGARTINSTVTTTYLFPGAQDRAGLTTVIHLSAQRDGLLKDFIVHHNEGAGNGNDIVYTVQVNDIDTAITVTIASTSTTPTTDLVNRVFVSQGDLISIKASKALGIQTSPQVVTANIGFE